MNDDMTAYDAKKLKDLEWGNARLIDASDRYPHF